MKPVNELLITGKITHDPVYEHTKTGIAVYRINIAYNYLPYGKQDYVPMYFKAALFKEAADAAHELGLQRGDSVKICGAIQEEEYNGKKYNVLAFAKLIEHEYKNGKDSTPAPDEASEDVPF